MEKVLRIGGYVRVSHEEQKKFGYSVKAQIQEIEKWCKEKNYVLVNMYIDEGFSASNMKRPQLQLMLNDLPKLDVIVFTRLDRLSRNVFEANKMLDLFKKNNTDMIAINEEDINTTTSNGMLMFNLKVTLAQHELLRGSERIKSVFEYKVREGQPVTGSLPFGYTIETKDGKKRIIKDEAVEKIVNEIFEHFATYRSIRATCMYINEKYNLSKDYKTYSRIIKRELYTGKYKSNSNYAPAYITEEQFFLNQEYIKKNLKIRKTKNVYLFAGMIKCPECGYNFIGKYYDRKIRHYSYVCNRHKKNNICTFKSTISEVKLEKFLLDNVEELLKQRNSYYKTNVEKLPEPEKESIKKRIKEIKLELENLTYAFRKNRITAKVYDFEYDELETELNKLQASLKSEPSVEHILNSNWKELYNDLEKIKKRALWQSLIKEIKLDKDKNIIVVFR